VSKGNSKQQQPRAPSPEAPSGIPLSRTGIRLRHLMYIIVYVALILAMGKELGVVSTLFFLAASALVWIFVTIAQQQVTQKEALLWVLSIAAARRMPLGQGVEAFAALSTGPFRRRVLGLAHLLKAGLPLPDALERIPGVIPASAAVLARVGWEAGGLPAALQDAVEQREDRLTSWRSALIKLEYPLALLLFMQICNGFILYFIVPRFEAIFRDFGVRLPSVTVSVIRLSHAPAVYWGSLLFCVLDLFLLFFIPASYFGWVEWRIPVLDRLFYRRHTAVIFRALATIIDAGRPLSNGFSSLARSYPRAWIRARLARVCHFTEKGESWITALQSQGLIRVTDAELLRSADRAGNLGWALKELANSGERRFAYRVQAFSQILFPIVVLMTGGVVFVFAVAYFSPIVQLIEGIIE
jgi:type II secretory pathway component PulF